MFWLATIVSVVVATELALALPLVRSLRAIQANLQLSFHVLHSKRISDHWKQRILPIYAGKMCVSSLKAFFLMSLVFASLLLPSLFVDGGLSAYVSRAIDLIYLIFMTVTFAGYLLLRRKISSRDP